MSTIYFKKSESKDFKNLCDSFESFRLVTTILTKPKQSIPSSHHYPENAKRPGIHVYSKNSTRSTLRLLAQILLSLRRK